MLLTASCLLSLLALASSLGFKKRDAGLSPRADSAFGIGYSDSLSHLFPREARPWAGSILNDQEYNALISRRHAESEANIDSVLGYTQLYARGRSKKPSGVTGGTGSITKATPNDKKPASNKGSPRTSTSGNVAPEADEAVKATKATLKEKFNWPPQNYGLMSPQERRAAAGKARTQHTRGNTAFFRDRIAQFEGSKKAEGPADPAGPASTEAGGRQDPPKRSKSPGLPVSSGASSQTTAFGPSSQSSPPIQGLGAGQPSRQNSGKSSKSGKSGVLVNSPDFLSPAHSTTSGGWTLVDE